MTQDETRREAERLIERLDGYALADLSPLRALLARVQELEAQADEDGQVIDNFNESTPKLRAHVAELEREMGDMSESYRTSANGLQKKLREAEREVARLRSWPANGPRR